MQGLEPGKFNKARDHALAILLRKWNAKFRARGRDAQYRHGSRPDEWINAQADA